MGNGSGMGLTRRSQTKVKVNGKVQPDYSIDGKGGELKLIFARGLKFSDKVWYIYLLLTEYEGRTVNYGPRFPPSTYGPSAKARAINRRGKQGSVIYSTDQETRLVRYLLYLFILR